MKTWEMIKDLTENPKKKFKTKSFNDNEMKAYVVEEFTRGRLTYRNTIVTEVLGQIEIIVLNEFILNVNWEEVKEPLTFIELLKSIRKNPRTISVENKAHGISYRRFYFNDMLEDLINEFPSNVIAEILLDSEFYIDD